MALQLKKVGIGKVHPLEGGFEAWLALDLPVEPISEEDVALGGSDLAEAAGVRKL